MQTIQVHLGERSYPIRIQQGIIDHVGEHFAELLGNCAAAIITDDNVGPLYLSRVEASLTAAGIRHTSIVLPHGERTKCLDSLTRLYDFLGDSGITRKDAVIALGGGVMGDLAGLAAATWLRGIRFMQIPTSLLAQVDSSVGGKVAVDLPRGKNLVGAFHQPSAVLVDPEVLNTLTEHFWLDGLGEVVKYGCINDAPLFELLTQAAPGGRPALMAHIDEILTRCIQAKADVVEQDEHDNGLRATLNFGHTMGHAVEAVQQYNGLSHGQAVAAGMAYITRVSEAAGQTESGTAARLVALLDTLGLPSDIPAGLEKEDLLRAMAMDKKKAGNSLTVVLIRAIGECFTYKTTAEYFR